MVADQPPEAPRQEKILRVRVSNSWASFWASTVMRGAVKSFKRLMRLCGGLVGQR